MLNRSGVQNAYSHKVRVGNWNEDKELHDLRMKEYLQRKENGQLLVHKVQQHLNASLSEVPLSPSPDNFVHIGDHLMLYSVATEGVLSCDPSDKISSSDPGFAVTTSTLTQAHVARNVFVLEGYGKGVRNGDVLKLGQPFRIRVNPRLSQDAFYLHSQPVSILSASKVTRRQEVALVNTPGYDTVWVAAYKDADKRFEMEGQPVPANAEIMIFHGQTRSGLASEKAPYHNDFGLEYEVCAHSHTSIKKKQGLYAELLGQTTSDIPVRKEGPSNHWAFLTAADADPLPQGPPAATQDRSNEPVRF
jgi:hypothetical protein